MDHTDQKSVPSQILWICLAKSKKVSKNWQFFLNILQNGFKSSTCIMQKLPMTEKNPKITLKII